MKNKLDEVFKNLWQDYISFNPHAKKIHDLFTARGETVINDHIALRTFDDPKINIEALAKVFVNNGYKPKGEYEFTEKKLFARHFEHKNPDLPKVFISELLCTKLSAQAQKILKGLIEQVPPHIPNQENFTYCGRPWLTSFANYETLAKESEYAAWISAFGFRPNHFTIFFNRLKTFKTLAELNSFLKENGFALNNSGGEIKGSPEVFLEQSSTHADEIEVLFSDGKHAIPACYYEFARRYPMPNGQLYQGFVEKSADKIFESTDRQ